MRDLAADESRPPARDDAAEIVLMSLVGYVSFAYYPIVGALAGTRGTDFGPFLRTPLDDAIPYLPIFAVSYGLSYVAPVASATAVARVGGMPALRRVFFGSLGLLALHYIFWLAFPSSARAIMLPVNVVGSSRWGPVVRAFYDMAPPWNAFPSLHVAGSWYFYRVLPRGRPVWARLYLLWFLTMFASTLVLKLHWFFDSAAGWLVGEAFYRIVRRLEARNRSSAWPPACRRTRLTTLAALLIALATGLSVTIARLGYPR